MKVYRKFFFEKKRTNERMSKKENKLQKEAERESM